MHPASQKWHQNLPSAFLDWHQFLPLPNSAIPNFARTNPPPPLWPLVSMYLCTCYIPAGAKQHGNNKPIKICGSSCIQVRMLKYVLGQSIPQRVARGLFGVKYGGFCRRRPRQAALFHSANCVCVELPACLFMLDVPSCAGLSRMGCWSLVDL